jgi:hypothetical protein
MTTLVLLEGGKKEPCPYCGEQPHVVPLRCPRISHIVPSASGEWMEIHFREETPDEEPEDDEPEDVAG